MVFVCNAIQIVISTLRLTNAQNAVAWLLAVLAVLRTPRAVNA